MERSILATRGGKENYGACWQAGISWRLRAMERRRSWYLAGRADRHAAQVPYIRERFLCIAKALVSNDGGHSAVLMSGIASSVGEASTGVKCPRAVCPWEFDSTRQRPSLGEPLLRPAEPFEDTRHSGFP